MAGRWEHRYVGMSSHLAQRMLEDGWEPFAVTVEPDGGLLLHLRRHHALDVEVTITAETPEPL